MAHQMDLFEEGSNRVEKAPKLPFQGHSPTSREAAQEAQRNASVLRRKVFQFIHAQGADGATDDEVQFGLGLDGSTQRPRRVELVRSGAVLSSGQFRKTRSGRNAIVWIASEYS